MKLTYYGVGDPGAYGGVFVKVESAEPRLEAYVGWHTSVEKWLHDPVYLKWIWDGTADPISESEARAIASKRGTTLAAAQAAINDLLAVAARAAESGLRTA